MSTRIGTILHGAYGDYYEQLVALRLHKQQNPNHRMVAFFASENRMTEMSVFDMTFFEEMHSASRIAEIHVDEYLLFQVHDRELRGDIISRLQAEVTSRMDLNTLNKPWRWVRRAWRNDPELCDIRLSPAGIAALPGCMASNDVDESLFKNRPTIGFLWRYRRPGGYVSSRGQPPEEILIKSKSALLQQLVDRYDATVLVAGMGLKTDDTNRERTDNKFTDNRLDVSGDCRYLKGVSWGLELELFRRCAYCFVMASGFSEALWLKRRGKNIVMVDSPPQYLYKLAYNRMPFFSITSPRNWKYYWLSSHSANNVLGHVNRELDQAMNLLC